jgi:hypothetical protein
MAYRCDLTSWEILLSPCFQVFHRQMDDSQNFDDRNRMKGLRFRLAIVVRRKQTRQLLSIGDVSLRIADSIFVDVGNGASIRFDQLNRFLIPFGPEIGSNDGL